MEKDGFDIVREQWERERPDLDASGVDVVWRISYIHKYLKNITSKKLGKYDLPLWAFDVLAVLRRVGFPFQASPSELCTAVQLTSGAMTNRLDRMEEAGMVRRQPDPEDRRGVIVQLTDKGKRLVDKAVEVRFDHAASAVASLSQIERQQLADILKKLVDENALR